jgi:hypothetical protein
VILYVLATVTAVALFVPWVQYGWSKPLVAGASELWDPKLTLRVIKELGDNSYPVAGLTLLGVITGIRALLRHGRRQSLLWLVTWCAIPLPLVLVLEHWAGYYFAIHHILHATPALILFAGYGLSYVGERLTILDRIPYQLSAPALAYVGLMIIASVWIAQSHWRREPVDWRGTAAQLQEMALPGDAYAMPKVYPLLEYHAPLLADYRTNDLDPSLGTLADDGIKRRVVVCYDGMNPDPCAGFRLEAMQDEAWSQQQISRFTVFVRER